MIHPVARVYFSTQYFIERLMYVSDHRNLTCHTTQLFGLLEFNVSLSQ